MQLLNRAYLKLYFLVLLLYVFFNKGVAYSYMAEILLVAGIFILFINRKQFEIGLNRKKIIVGIFILISFLFIKIVNEPSKDSDDVSLLVDFSDHPLYWIGGFTKLISNAVTSSESVAKNIDQIILSLQFQDITKQQIDQAVKPLEKIKSNIEHYKKY